MRETFGREAFLVGFKLLSGATKSELLLAARGLLVKNRLNLVIANDLSRLHDGQHPVMVVTPEGYYDEADGPREEVARKLADYILRRANTTWFHSRPDESLADQQPSPAAVELYADTLALAQAMNLFTGTAGNVTARDDSQAGTLLSSPRQVNKKSMTADDAILAQVDTARQEVKYRGSMKPSIDTATLHYVYDYSGVESTLHFHDGWGRMSTTTDFPYPCGTLEEGEAILQALERGRMHDTMTVELRNHGFLLGFPVREFVERMSDDWRAVQEEFHEHVRDVAQRTDLLDVELNPEQFKPIFDGLTVAGLVYADPEAAILYLAQEHRDKGLGTTVAQQFAERHYTVRAATACDVKPFYLKKGFTEKPLNDDLSLFIPPDADEWGTKIWK
jgi:hypothetical protein